MSFYLAETPTLEAVANEDEQVLTQDLQARVAQAVELAEALEPVAEAVSAQQAAQDRLERLRAAERTLNRQAKESRERVVETSEKALESLVEAAASGKKLEFKRLDELATGEAQIRTLGQAIERLTEHLIPQAQIANLREESHGLAARSRALERIAQERAEKVLEQLRGAVSEEMVLPVDMSKGVAGALLARAAGLEAASDSGIGECRPDRASVCREKDGMRDIRRYWKDVRALESTLPEFLWLVDVDGSAPVEVSAARAAQLLLAKSHRMASEEELSVQRGKEVVASKEMRRDTRRREGIAVVPFK